MRTIFRLTILERSQSLTRLDQLTRNLRRILTGRMVLSNKSRLHPWRKSAGQVRVPRHALAFTTPSDPLASRTHTYSSHVDHCTVAFTSRHLEVAIFGEG